MAEPLLSFTHLTLVLGLALLYSIHLNTKPTVTAGGAAATSKRFAIVRASLDNPEVRASLHGAKLPLTYFMSDVPDDLSQCLTARWQAGSDWCKGFACKLRTDSLHCVPSQLRSDTLSDQEHCNYLKQEFSRSSWPTQTMFQRSQTSRNFPSAPTDYPPVNEMLEWVEDCGWALHSASRAIAGDRYKGSQIPEEMYVFARPKAVEI